MDWFRWHHGSVNDPKFQLVAKKSGASVAEVIAVWACLLEAASMADSRGNPGDPDFDAMDCSLGFDDGKAQRIYERMNERALIAEDGHIVAWDKRQPKREREDDNSTERSRSHRAKQRQATPSNASDDTGTPRGDKRREEEKKDPPASRVPRATRKCPDDFALTAEMREWAEADAQGVDLERETAKFRDYTFKASRSDWPATWKNWMREAFDRLPKPQARASPSLSFRERDTKAKEAKFRQMAGIQSGDIIDMEAPSAPLIANG